MNAVHPSCHTAVEQAYTLAAQHAHRVDAPHLVWSIIQTNQWPETVPAGAETFLQAVIQAAPHDAKKPRDTTLYAQFVIERAHNMCQVSYFTCSGPPGHTINPLFEHGIIEGGRLSSTQNDINADGLRECLPS